MLLGRMSNVMVVSFYIHIMYIFPLNSGPSQDNLHSFVGKKIKGLRDSDVEHKQSSFQSQTHTDFHSF